MSSKSQHDIEWDRDNFVILHLKKLTYVFRTLICVNYPCVVNATK